VFQSTFGLGKSSLESLFSNRACIADPVRSMMSWVDAVREGCSGIKYEGSELNNELCSIESVRAQEKH
jgi:hypothetical protein